MPAWIFFAESGLDQKRKQSISRLQAGWEKISQALNKKIWFTEVYRKYPILAEVFYKWLGSRQSDDHVNNNLLCLCCSFSVHFSTFPANLKMLEALLFWFYKRNIIYFKLGYYSTLWLSARVFCDVYIAFFDWTLGISFWDIFCWIHWKRHIV